MQTRFGRTVRPVPRLDISNDVLISRAGQKKPSRPARATTNVSNESAVANPSPKPPKKRQKKQKDYEELPPAPIAALDKLPTEVLQRILGYISITHLISIIELSSTCRYLRDFIRSEAPWLPILRKLAAPEPDPATILPDQPKKHRDPTQVDPKDLKKDPFKLLAKYGPRLCLNCFELQENKSRVLKLYCPTPLVDVLGFKAEEDGFSLDDVEPVWTEELENDDDEPHAPIMVCVDCRSELMEWARALADIAADSSEEDNWMYRIPGCTEPWNKATHYWINQKNAKDIYKLEKKDFGRPWQKVVLATRRIRGSWPPREYEIVEYRYDETDVLEWAWEVHGGPWGLEALEFRRKRLKRRRVIGKRKRERKEARQQLAMLKAIEKERRARRRQPIIVPLEQEAQVSTTA